MKLSIFNLFKRKKMSKDTAIKTIHPYKWFYNENDDNSYSWVFDDPAVGLNKEALVAGADVICDQISKRLGKNKFAIQFSEFKFPTAAFHGDMKEGRIDRGTTFYSPELKMEFWLCPALGKYFEHTPKQLILS